MQRDTRTVLDSGNDFDRAVVQLSNTKNQGQAQTGPIRGAALLQAAEKPVKGTSLAFCAEAGAVIAHRDRHPVLVVCDVDSNSRAREAQRIIEQVS